MRRFEGRTAYVTGAASGIGRATALRLAAEGARVAGFDVQSEGLEETCRQAVASGAESAAFLCDVADEESVRSAVGRAVREFGPPDVLCNIAGILRFCHTHEESLEQWHRVLAVNLTGTFLMCRETIPHLLARRGVIVNMSSTAALSGHAWTAAYSAAKGGVLALTRELAIEYGKQGLRVNAVCPGAIDTPIRNAFQIPRGGDPKLIDRIMPLNDFAPPEQCAAAIAFLASDDAAHVHGTALLVDGGMLA